MKLYVMPVYGWGWSDGVGTIDVPAVFYMDVTVTQPGEPFVSGLGRFCNNPAHPLSGLWIFLDRRTKDGNYNLRAYAEKITVPEITESLPGNHVICGFAIAKPISKSRYLMRRVFGPSYEKSLAEMREMPAWKWVVVALILASILARIIYHNLTGQRLLSSEWRDAYLIFMLALVSGAMGYAYWKGGRDAVRANFNLYYLWVGLVVLLIMAWAVWRTS